MRNIIWINDLVFHMNYVPIFIWIFVRVFLWLSEKSVDFSAGQMLKVVRTN